MSPPPRLARLLIRLFASIERNESYLGDIDEIYAERIASGGVRRARLWYRREALRSLPAYLRDSLAWSLAMLKNYFKTAFRSLLRHRAYSLINILGLATGMACALLIWLWVQDELGFDRFHEHSGTLFRVERDNGNASTPYPFGPALEAELPEFADVARVGNPGTLLVQAGERSFYETGLLAVDPAFLRMFTFPMVRGEGDAALNRPFAVLISWDMADKYFPGRDPLGQTLTFNKEFVFTVAGVMKNPPPNSTLRAHFLVPLDRMEDLRATRDYWKDINRWDLQIFQTWVRLKNSTSAPEVGKKITALFDDHTKFGRGSWTLRPLTDIRLAMSRSQVILFSGLAFFILLVACVNFMNLATARAANRAKEIGLRKVVGAFRRSIVVQFLGEAFLTTVLAVLAAAVLFVFLFPAFQRISGKAIGLEAVLSWRFGVGLSAIILLTGFMAGSYPALLLSSFHPVTTLKGRWRAGARSASFRRGLVVFQFALSALLLIGTGVISRQVNHMRTMKLGYDKDHLIFLSLRTDTAKSFPVLKTELKSATLVQGATASFQLPTNNTMKETGTTWEGMDKEANHYVYYDDVDYDYVETLGLGLAAGRSFSRKFVSDAGGAFLVNETMVKQMGISSPAGAIGKILTSWNITGPIVGVLKDYNFQSARSAIEPQVVSLGRDKLRYAVFRLTGGLIQESLDRVKEAWRKVNPGHPFEYRFFDEAFENMYRDDERLGTMLKYFAFMGVMIACLGLFGLASFTAALRTKEIGVRKVLGASSPRLALLLGKEFFVWVAVANVLSWPVAFLAMNKWLETFAFRPAFGWWLFPAAAAGSLALALATVGYQAVRAARADPVESLKYE